MEDTLRRIRQLYRTFFEKPPRTKIIYLSLGLAPFILAAETIFWNFRLNGLSHWDEYYFTATAAWYAARPSWASFQAWDPPLFPLLMSFMFQSFGFQDYVAVATSSVAAFLLCVSTFSWVMKEYDFRTAVIGTSIVASNEFFLLYARMALSDMTFSFFFTCAVFLFLGALRCQKKWVYLLAGSLLALTFATKYNGFQPLVIIALFLPLFHLLSVPSRARLRQRMIESTRAMFQSISGLLVSTVPSIIFFVFFLAYIAMPFSYIDPYGGSFLLLRDFVPRLSRGLELLVGTVYPTKAAISKLRLFVEGDFYYRVLTSFVTIPVLVLALVGALKGIVRRNLADILLIIWFGYVFTYFSSVPVHYPRVILPVIVPLVILAARGAVWSLIEVDQLLHSIPRIPFVKIPTCRTLLRYAFVIAIVLSNLISAAGTINNTHSAYRTAADFISEHVPDGEIVWIKAQPVLIAYLGLKGKNVRVSYNIEEIDKAYVIVLDFVAKSYPEYPEIAARLSRMKLIASFQNDVPIVTMLDWTDFVGLQRFKSDPDRSSIRIYARI